MDAIAQVPATCVIAQHRICVGACPLGFAGRESGLGKVLQKVFPSGFSDQLIGALKLD